MSKIIISQIQDNHHFLIEHIIKNYDKIFKINKSSSDKIIINLGIIKDESFIKYINKNYEEIDILYYNNLKKKNHLIFDFLYFISFCCFLMFFYPSYISLIFIFLIFYYFIFKNKEKKKKINWTKYYKDLEKNNSFDYCINITMDADPIITKLDKKKYFFIFHDSYSNFKQDNVYALTPLSCYDLKNIINIDTLPKLSLQRNFKHKVPNYFIMLSNKSKRDYELLREILKINDFDYKITLIGNINYKLLYLLLPLIIKNYSKIIVKHKLNFIDYHNEFNNCDFLIHLVSFEKNKQYFDFCFMSSIIYHRSYNIKSIICRKLDKIYNLNNKKYLFNDKSDIKLIFEKSLKDYYK